MNTYIPTSSTSKISELNVRADGSGWLTYPNGVTSECSVHRVELMLAGAEFKLSPLNDCPARIYARLGGSVGGTYDDGQGNVHVYDRKSHSCTVCAPERVPAPEPTPEEEMGEAVELVRALAVELAAANAALLANPNNVDTVDAVLAVARRLEQTVYGS